MLRKLLIITCMVSTVAVAYGQKKKRKSKGNTQNTTVARYKEVGDPMPPIRLVNKDLKVTTHADLDKKDDILVMMFNPTCQHCIEMTHLLRSNLEMFDETELVLMAAPVMIDNLQYFEDMTHYPKYPKLQVGVDSSGFIDKTFRYNHLPQINIYDKKRNLVKVFEGEVPIDSLKPYVK